MSEFDKHITVAAGLKPSEAIRYFRQKDLIPTARWGEVMNEAHSRGFAVAGATSEALLTDLKAAINSAVTDGTTLREFQKSFQQIAKTHKWEHNGSPGWRARIIYTTNLATAYAAGQYAQLDTEEARTIFPYWRYVHHACQHPRADHMAWSGLVLRNDDPWWATHYPPNGWRCHCTVEPVTRSEMGRQGWTVAEAPPLDPRPWKNPATGKIEMVPRGIDPSFAYNPGMAWKDKQMEQAKRTPALTPRSVMHLSPRAAREQQAEDIGTLLRPHATGLVNAGTLPQAVKDGLGTQADDVILSDDTLGKNRKHRELTDDDYKHLPDMLADALLAVQDKPHHATLLGRWGDKMYRIVIKKTRSGDVNFYQSFRRAHDDELKKLIRRYADKIFLNRTETDKHDQ